MVHVEGIMHEVGVEDNNFGKGSRPPDISKRRLVEEVSVIMGEKEVVSLMSSKEEWDKECDIKELMDEEVVKKTPFLA